MLLRLSFRSLPLLAEFFVEQSQLVAGDAGFLVQPRDFGLQFSDDLFFVGQFVQTLKREISENHFVYNGRRFI